MEIGSGSWTESGGSSSSSPPNSSESLNGLKFGQKIYFEDVGLGPPPKSGGGSSSNAAAQPRKAKGGAVQGTQPPRCQVEGCNVDLSDVKAYYSRHKVCSMHSKSSKVVVAGLEQRFCQQCSRFHQLPEFDQGKRSCRRRLAGHNERRRKPPPGALLSSRYNRLASSVYENGGRVGSFVMDFSAYPRRDAPRLAPANQITATGKYLPQHPWHSNTENDLFLQASTIPPGPGECFSDSSCALSLLSNQPWNRTSGIALVSSDQAPAAPPPHTTVVANPFPGPSWGFRGNEAGSGASLGMASHPGNLLSGELEQDRRHYMELEHPRPYDSSHPMHHHWSL